jgi:16S rRNA (guanine527-N7)-methyltransferase
VIATEGEARDWLASMAECGGSVMDRLDRLVELLREENSRQNLVSQASLDHVWQRHIADSAQLLREVPRGTSPWLDLGTGAGFPGLVIAAMRPECQVLMIESRKRRAEWLSSAVAALGLDSATVLGARLETVRAQPMAVISARAFAPLDRLLALSARFSTSDTLWLLPKGRSAQHEVDGLHGWDHTFHVKQSLTDAESGIVVGKVTGAARKDKGS